MIASRAFPLFFRWLVRLPCGRATSCFRLDSVCFCRLFRHLIYGLFRCFFRFIAASFLLTPLLMPSRRVVPFASLLASLFALAACSSSSVPELRASSPVIYVSSHRLLGDVLNCLEDKLPSVSTSKLGSASELLVGPNAWLVTLTPSQYGSTVRVQKSSGDYSGLSEPEMRFDIARCTT
jgi:hypothetical protein